jgi:hypothetical protein
VSEKVVISSGGNAGAEIQEVENGYLFYARPREGEEGLPRDIADAYDGFTDDPGAWRRLRYDFSVGSEGEVIVHAPNIMALHGLQKAYQHTGINRGKFVMVPGSGDLDAATRAQYVEQGEHPIAEDPDFLIHDLLSHVPGRFYMADSIFTRHKKMASAARLGQLTGATSLGSFGGIDDELTYILTHWRDAGNIQPLLSMTFRPCTPNRRKKEEWIEDLLDEQEQVMARF